MSDELQLKAPVPQMDGVDVLRGLSILSVMCGAMGAVTARGFWEPMNRKLRGAAPAATAAS